MKIQLVSFNLNRRFDKAKEITSVINASNADIILFPGWTLNSVEDIDKIEVYNKKSTVIFESKKGRVLPFSCFNNELFCITGGNVVPLHTCQQFATSSEANSNELLVPNLIHELENNRKIIIDNRTFRIIQCGELNVLRNLQNNGNKVLFRFIDDSDLNKRFETILNETDCFLNPIHSPMGNQGKLKARRVFLSENGRGYFSVSNSLNGNFGSKSVHYAYINGYELFRTPETLGNNDYSCSWIYDF